MARCRCGRASANGVECSAQRVGLEDNHAKSASACVLRGRSVGSPRGEALSWAASHGTRKLHWRCFEAAAVDMARWRCGRASSNGVGWSSPRVGREGNHAKSASARVLRGRSAGSPRGEARAGRAPRDSEASVTLFRSRSRRPGAVSVRKSLGQRRGVQRALGWPRRKPCQVRQRARAPRAVGRFSTGQSARGPRATELGSFDDVAPKPQPPIWRGVGEKCTRATAWGGTRNALAAKTTTPSPPARACSMGGRPVLHGANRVRVAPHGVRKL